MVHPFVNIFQQPFLIMGIFIVTGYVGSLVLNKIGVPHIVTYLFTGLILVNTLFVHTNFNQTYNEWFHIIETLALGLIGFKIGTELKIKSIMQEPKVLTVILLAESLSAFVLVYIIVLLFTQNQLEAILLGGLATATAPAATVEIIRKLRASGPLTTRIQWLLAFDDVLAVFIIEGILVYVSVSIGGNLNIFSYFSGVVMEIGLAVLIGSIIGYLLDMIVENMHDDLEMMELTFAVLILAMGIASSLGTSTILATMVIGATVTNRKGDNYERAGDLLEILMSPVIAIFFILVGASVLFSDFSHFPILAVLYLIGRTTGKIFGAYYGARSCKLEPKIRNNLGLGLLAQGGVALGLVTVANEILIAGNQSPLGHEIVTTIVISTIMSEILGSYGAQFAIRRAGEVDKDISPLDVDEDHTRELHGLI